ncbi:flagellar motor protein MotD [Crenobacter caeni]|uniref:Flagellar motor protein MotD n=1 Tax=Crenobacter caeni TaxID=2705474 RepID=A0A6B2KQJ5_9NEIS|nr:flagellar motor protein MotD [Crenobacter caeni]
MSRRRRRHEEEHENHERWLVSYADFITLLFAFFVVMYAVSQVNESKYRSLSSALVDAFGTSPLALQSKPSGSANTQIAAPDAKYIARKVASQPVPPKTQADRLERTLNEVLAPLSANGQVKVSRKGDDIQVDIRDNALFPVGQATPSPESIRLVTALSGVLVPLDSPIKVEGFSDNVPIRNANYPSNWELSAARAGSVVRLLQENGVAAERLVAIGRAETRPLADNTSEQGRAQNRRVAITILARGKEELAALPSTLTEDASSPTPLRGTQ